MRALILLVFFVAVQPTWAKKQSEMDLIKKAVTVSLSPHKIKDVQLLQKVGERVYVQVRSEKFCYKMFYEKVKKSKKVKRTFYRRVHEVPVETCRG